MSLTEIIHRNEVTTLLLRKGYNIYLPMVDHGIDFIIHHDSDGDLKMVQQKSRWTIHKKYIGRDIWIAFRSHENWYLIEHDRMIDLCARSGTQLDSTSWRERGSYSRAHLSREQVQVYRDYLIGAA
ncbi:hypothetical protein KX928_01680 [Roseobacter sp. YSTF-M11]|uniref:PD(D/E)XK endonuclease domain-containing protein n=1 Tax=Roseobacter insulae TaxID=2859783 RepID=A0A9X1JWS8_9RHOB|nr:hypothetical protein [Roseobacter insulae]MBW4706485.1 hypothetical protein [Roseobacter insulae]